MSEKNLLFINRKLFNHVSLLKSSYILHIGLRDGLKKGVKKPVGSSKVPKMDRAGQKGINAPQANAPMKKIVIYVMNHDFSIMILAFRGAITKFTS